jgi:hypothetical protein
MILLFIIFCVIGIIFCILQLIRNEIVAKVCLNNIDFMIENNFNDLGGLYKFLFFDFFNFSKVSLTYQLYDYILYVEGGKNK